MSLEQNPVVVFATVGVLVLSLIIMMVLVFKSLLSTRRKLVKLGARVALNDSGKPIAVDFEGQEIKDDDLRHLRGLKTVERLWLNETQITDEGLKHLQGLSNLKELELYQTFVSDEGMESVIQLPKLKSLLLEATKVTEQGVEKIKAALPNCRVRC